MDRLPVFPDLPGQAWPVRRTPVAGSTRIRTTVSGRRAALALWKHPLFEFELNFSALASDESYPGAFARSKQMLEGFFLQQQGGYGAFAFVDKTDANQVGAALGKGDGATTDFVAQRTIGAYQGPADYVMNVDTVYADGVALDPSTWDLVLPNVIRMASAPASGVVLTVDFWWAYICQFADDRIDLDQFMWQIWELRSLKLRGVRSV
jgi:hypothetical protein